ncbi:MAG: 23S rRNA pseudouridine synthase F [Parcubacteria group bacterium CG08_land_8_20_14_0_20_48_21]|nr:MAG: hypothetical protein AUK21_02435 [Parcubacteria group bacterium CG2_30_48_51]PIS32589.1 MAG: 23S rRNA pseudouridine synthase F [Parcubacteria group bacterium CG08_land_8_20_14_0_20_48_21]PIW78829.1 MAG: 23S rRNA pseudouridine synthase F [Parcubacteria group bacterium CG_4_8_14_3_um_filter_48_16]PIY78002.1 MAG: 23S rRNA pseudouridine synthase F [Parcubacteria group bacterium CG_4_10_14_0_8_um_filter_48_154]PIZ77119.1 MAG: 23S rRNA pseudouridine synthase F [bacterium CG_4_10_14_0_2_um_fil
MRINKYLAEAGCCSRRDADGLIRKGRVLLNGKRAQLGDRVGNKDRVTLSGKTVKPQSKKIYLLYHKPVGVITTTEKGVHGVLDQVRVPERVYPVGRLDVATSGLLLLTNDGRVVNRMLKGKYGHEKEYEVTVDKTITVAFLESLRCGIVLDDHSTLPAQARKIGDREFSLTLIEGRNRQVRRMCETLGYRVTKLARVRILHLHDRGLRPGMWRLLTEQEQRALFKELHLSA